MSTQERSATKPLVVRPAEGRRYDMGRMRAIFFADRDETGFRYSVAEWWLEPRTPGPGPHSHPEDHIFYVLAGTLSLLVDGEWTEATRGCYAILPGGTQHTFENRSDQECGFMSITTPGGFEERMPDFLSWFAEHPIEELPGAPPERPAER